jgi:hypothetical protein
VEKKLASRRRGFPFVEADSVARKPMRGVRFEGATRWEQGVCPDRQADLPCSTSRRPLLALVTPASLLAKSPQLDPLRLLHLVRRDGPHPSTSPVVAPSPLKCAESPPCPPFRSTVVRTPH